MAARADWKRARARARSASRTARASSATASPRPRELLEGGPIDFLTGDYLAELTMLILWKARQRDPSGGLRGHLPAPDGGRARPLHREGRARRGRTRAGSTRPASPRSSASSRRRSASTRGSRTSRATTCCRASASSRRRATGSRTSTPGARSRPRASRRSPRTRTSAASGIAACLDAGADVVVCPRVTDASLVVGPDRLALRLGARRLGPLGERRRRGPRPRVRRADDRRQLRLLPRGARASSTPASRSPRSNADGTFVVTKHPGTGGLVSVGTVTAQLLYEIAEPAYANPDATARFDTIRLAQDGPGPRARLRRARRAAAARPQGVHQLRRRLPQLDDARADRARRRGEGGARRAQRARAPRRSARAARAPLPASRAPTRPTPTRTSARARASR